MQGPKSVRLTIRFSITRPRRPESRRGAILAFLLPMAGRGMATKPLEGRLYRYRSSPGSLQAFESGPATTSSFAVYVGGLTDGLLACSYVEALAEECASRGWALVQPILSSSYAGYGTGGLDRDVDELSMLARHLATERGAKSLVLIGHSTGCQDAVHFMATAADEARELVRGVVLQAPVSDREAASLEGGAEERAALLQKAEALCAEGRGDTLITLQYGFVPLTGVSPVWGSSLGHEHSSAPIGCSATHALGPRVDAAARFASLNGRGGPDDMFSSDFSDAELRAKLGHLAGGGCRTVFAHSLADEYVPPSVDVEALALRFVAAAGGAAHAEALILRDAKHNLDSPDGAAARQFVARVGDLLVEVAQT